MQLQSDKRRGNALVVGVTLTTLLGFGALSVDLGVIRVASTQLQAGLDAASLSGAGYLDGSEEAIAVAVDETVAMAARNTVLGGPIALAEGDVTPGTWDPDEASFTPWAAGDDPADVNAIRIEHQAPDAAPALGTAAFGATGYAVRGTSTGVVAAGEGPAGSTDCFLPLAIPDCYLASVPPGTNPPPMIFSMSPSPTDSIAWADPDRNPNSNELRNQLVGQCSNGEIALGDPIYVNEGQHNSAMHTIRDILNSTSAVVPDAWDASLYGAIPLQGDHPTHPGSSVLDTQYGNVLQGPVALVDAGADCANPSFTHSLPLTGIAWAVIYDVSSQGGDKHLKIQLDLVHEHHVQGEVDEASLGTNVLGTGKPILVRGG